MSIFEADRVPPFQIDAETNIFGLFEVVVDAQVRRLHAQSKRCPKHGELPLPEAPAGCHCRGQHARVNQRSIHRFLVETARDVEIRDKISSVASRVARETLPSSLIFLFTTC